MSVGASYFGNRILRHAAADMADLAERGFTGVLHTFSENDLAHYREQIARLVAASHDVGLEVQLNPWGLGGVFGGEADSGWVAAHPERGQVLDDGTLVGAGCLSDPQFRAFVRGWADAAVAAGADRVFWDEPHWANPVRYGLSPERWACRCQRCRAAFAERFGEAMPAELTAELVAFREDTLVDFVREMVAHVAASGGRSTVCLLPLDEGSLALRDWTPVAAAPGLDTLATDPYWKVFGHPVEPFVADFAAKTRDLAEAHHLTPQVWVQGFGLGPEDVADIHAAVNAIRRAGVTDVWVWGYEACGHMPSLGTREPEVVWAQLCAALTGSGVEASA